MEIKLSLLSNSLKLFSRSRIIHKYCTTSTYKNFTNNIPDEYTAIPQYPPIEKTDPESLERKREKEWYNKIKRLLTVEEKMFEVNIPRLYGWKCFMVREGIIPYNNLEFTKHMTRTHLFETENLPDYYNKYSEKIFSELQNLQGKIIDAIEYQLDVRHHNLSKISEPLDKEKEITNIIVNEINRVIINHMQNDESFSHLKNIQIDYAPRLEASWKINSLVETFVEKENKYGIPLNELPEEYLNRPSDKFIQYVGSPILQLRHCNPLPQLIELSEGNIFNYSVPIYKYDPHITLGYEMDRRHITNIPGFWPGDDREFSFLSYHFSNHIKHRPPTYGVVDAKEALQSQAIFASFGWLMPLTCYQGFSNYHDVTYPFVTQTILTDGRMFTFASYQLNTTELHYLNAFENPKCNICWMTPALPLYEAFENGKIKGINQDVVHKLLQFYMNKPQSVAGRNLKPYLGDKIKCIANYEDDEKVEWLEKKFKKFSSNTTFNKPQHVYEVYDWERIYKIKFRMRPRDARKRPFELRQNPYQKKMTEESKEYIPKINRPDKLLPKWRQKKFKTTFYPE